MANEQGRFILSSPFLNFIKLESAGGILLLLATILAMIAANTSLESVYELLLNTQLVIRIGEAGINKPLLLWINDGLMAVFFFLIGLEIKREVCEGELSSVERITLPAIGATGGIAAPVCIYVVLNWGTAGPMDGWAIPAATDIAFALVLLRAFGNRVPISLKAFLLALAIFDDLAAIVIIALFYTDNLSPVMLVVAIVALLGAVVLNRHGVKNVTAYVLIGLVLWVALLKSGVHATLAGVLIAFCIPLGGDKDESPLKSLERDLHVPVAFAVLPIFAFANAGISFAGIGLEDFADPVTLGIALGLFVGNPVGILGLVGLAVLFRWVSLPQEVTWGQLTGTAFACGIGFTMSLFIAGLAFEHGDGSYWAADKLGILIGSLASAAIASVILHIALPSSQKSDE